MSLPTVLIVDDEPDVRKLLHLVMDNGHWRVIDAADGRQAMSKLESYRPDLVLLDIMLQGKPDGLELLELIKKDRQRNAKVIMVTARAQYDDVLKAAQMSCDAYVVKPFTQDHLMETIDKVMNENTAA
jgi:DNA-binding response OmpR family regulator